MASKRKCGVPGCVIEGTGSVSYHRLTSSVERGKILLEALGLQEPLRQQICSQHFESDSFVSSASPEAWEGAGYKRRRLYNAAVPVFSASTRTLLDTSDERVTRDIVVSATSNFFPLSHLCGCCVLLKFLHYYISFSENTAFVSALACKQCKCQASNRANAVRSQKIQSICNVRHEPSGFLR